jgi:hypothetical protein
MTFVPDQITTDEWLTILKCYGVAKAVVEFSGSGDSGQIDGTEVEGLADAGRVPVKPEHVDDSVLEAAAHEAYMNTPDGIYETMGYHMDDWIKEWRRR